MKKAKNKQTTQSPAAPVDIEQYSIKTDRKHLIWFNGEKHELDVYRIPTKHLHFNIQNGRYADKMIQLRSDHPGDNIDPRVDKWRDQISKMLCGQYPGTQEDREPWERLREDIKGKSQLTPGVVIADGGVIDGNRRLSVLLNLADDKQEKNPTRYQYFEGVILPHNVSDEDRWRIEAGIQLGKDEKHDYSSINKILKIKEGLTIFGSDAKGIREIAKALYGTTEKEIGDTIKEIALIDDYLNYLGKKEQYNEVAGLTERFVEAVNTLDAAKNNGHTPQEFGKLKLLLFAGIRGKLVENWDIREIRKAIAPPKKEKAVAHLSEKILNELLTFDAKPSAFKEAFTLPDPSKSPLMGQIKDKLDKFLDQRKVLERINEPRKLVDSAKSNLEALQESLGTTLPKHPDREATLEAVNSALAEILKLAKACQAQLKAKKA